MRLLDLTFSTPEENLACDEALLDCCENGFSGEILRFWEPAGRFVVLGYSSKRSLEVNADSCAREGVPVLRRMSGGGTVVQGSGCLNYSLILRIGSRKGLETVTRTNAAVMGRNREALETLLGPEVAVRGHTDMVLGDRKFSGNAQRRRKDVILFHGSLLVDFDLAQIERLLPVPPRQPEYRRNRAHRDFLMNLHLKPAAVKKALAGAWKAGPEGVSPPVDRIRELASGKYSSPDWNARF